MRCGTDHLFQVVSLTTIPKPITVFFTFEYATVDIIPYLLLGMTSRMMLVVSWSVEHSVSNYKTELPPRLAD
jgi:hypothetical protein